MEKTAVEWLIDQMNNIKGSSMSMNGRVQFIEKELNNSLEQAKAIEKIEKLKRQLFIGKVSEIIGMDKTIELLKECIETFKSE